MALVNIALRLKIELPFKTHNQGGLLVFVGLGFDNNAVKKDYLQQVYDQ